MSDYSDRPWLALYPEGLSAEVPDVPFTTVADFAVDAMKRWADLPAFENMGTTLSFAEVDRLSAQFAVYLREVAGLREGERVVLVMPNVLQFPIALFGAIRAGLIPVNANPLYTDVELRGVFMEATPAAVVVLENFTHVVGRAMPGTSVRVVIETQVGDLLALPKRAAVELALRLGKKIPAHTVDSPVPFRQALRMGAGGQVPRVSAGRDDVALLQFTGGTSGVPKAVMLTHGNLLANQAQLSTPGSIPLNHGEEVVLTALPLYHIFCFTVNCLALFGMGALNVLVTNPRDIRALVRTIARSRPSVMMLVSTLASALLDNDRFRSLSFDALKVSIAGGMSVRDVVASRWLEVTGRQLLEGYGLTEASPVVALNPLWGQGRTGTIGLPLQSTEVRIVDAHDGAPVPLGQPGELSIRGPQVMKGYWNTPEETAQVLSSDGWLLTGDIATMDEQGFLRIVDRKKDLIVVGGFNVYPNEVEAVIASHPLVGDVGVIGVPDEYSGEAVRAYVVRRDPSLTEDELTQWCRKRLTGYKRPRRFIFVSELPKSAVGKVLRRQLREHAPVD